MKSYVKKIVSALLIIALVFGVTVFVSEVAQQPTTVKAVSFAKRQAKRMAKEYLSSSAFSKKGLYDQLRYEGFSKKQARYGVNHCKANWKKQAKRMAKEYLRSSAFSKSGLYEQLVYEGFSNKQAKYGVKHCKANWKKQAARMAREYLDSSSFSRQSLYEQLIYEGFTDSQARYGVSKAYR